MSLAAIPILDIARMNVCPNIWEMFSFNMTQNLLCLYMQYFMYISFYGYRNTIVVFL